MIRAAGSTRDHGSVVATDQRGPSVRRRGESSAQRQDKGGGRRCGCARAREDLAVPFASVVAKSSFGGEDQVSTVCAFRFHDYFAP